ncbi:hypothetical protein [Helicobacter mehlei]|uniref:hypothetical protein n=1 Tax=Helicobacter mehlei TaxID=2316080 RepID=UPI0013CDEF6F|nr:hypothetical protein [Helicobacter mehlei]
MPTDLSPKEEAQLESFTEEMIARAGNPQEDNQIPEETPLEQEAKAQAPSALLEPPKSVQTDKGQYSAQTTLATPPSTPQEQPPTQTPLINKGTCDPSRIYALIENNTIRDIFRGDTLPEYNADQLDIRVLPLGEEQMYSVGLALKEGELQPLSLEQIKQRQISFIDEDFEAEMLEVQNEYIPLEEILTFEMQRQEALSLQQGGQTPFLDKLAAARGESKEALAGKILKKHADYMGTLAVLLGNRHKLRTQIEQSKDPQEIMQIAYKSPLKA